MKKQKELIILGNGFDILAGLKTKYDDYFKNIKNRYDEYSAKNRYGDGEFPGKFTFWHTIFIHLVTSNSLYTPWYDVETEMLDFLHNYQYELFWIIAWSSNSEVQINELEKTYKKAKQDNINNKKNDDSIDYFKNKNLGINYLMMKMLIENETLFNIDLDTDTLFKLVRLFVPDLSSNINQMGLRDYELGFFNLNIKGRYKDGTSYLIKDLQQLSEELNSNIFPRSLPRSKVSVESINNGLRRNNELLRKHPFLFDNFLHKQLRDFEEDFANYIERISNTSNYSDAADTLLRRLSKKDNSNTMIETNVFSFNYTVPIIIDESPESSYNSFRNLHGNINEPSSIIFGVDNTNLFNDTTRNLDEPTRSSIVDHLLPYTKTFRTLSMNNEDKDINHIGNVDFIKIFGHSMSASDYSYYQSIFDANDIYNSNTKLIFYYYDYSDSQTSRQSIQSDIYLRISNLLNRYGDETILNHKQGQNLLHKLQLENRLKIDEIKDEEIKDEEIQGRKYE